MPLDNDTANGLAPVTVGVDAAEVDPTLSSVTLQVDNFTTGVIKIDRGLLTDAGFDIDGWIRDKFAKRFYRGASNLIVNGNAGSVQSLASAYNTGVTTGTTGVIKYADLVSAMVALDPAYAANAVWAMNNATLGAILSITDSAGRPVFLPDYGSAAVGFVGTILGRPVKLVTQLPNVATGNAPILFGDFKQGYVFRQQAPGLEIIRLNERYAAGYEVGFVGFARVGGVALKAGVNSVVAVSIK
ncbi:phage major capsid protein [Terriglobus roseus]|uniref:Phage major capsid protein, HK97 family n=1 Tax=Terriglobus roseus TaxID=392734 RepID=A0A1H4J3E0_9BACT|nr:phage major capsid protein [Terriglobus roseus]SEB40747.1 phage major capsid protein, HK97 family [Terriglobus roseus]